MYRLLKILEYSLASLGRRKWKNISIVIAYSLTISILSSILFLTHSLKEMATEVLQASPEIVVQRLAGGRHELIPISYAEKVASIPGVGEVTPRVWGYYYDALFQANYTMLGINGELDLEITKGKVISENGECMVGEGVATHQQGDVGDELLLIASSGIGFTCEITGVFTSDSSMWTNDLIVFTEGDVRDFFGIPDELATDLGVKVFNPSEVNNIAEKIRRMFPDSRPVMKSEILHTYESVFNWRSGMMLTIFAASVCSFILLAWDKATGISGDEKQEIGILKAIGWSTSDVLLLKFFEGGVISITSFLLGMLAAYIHVFIFDAPLLSAVLKGWSVLFPDFQLVPYIDLGQVLVLATLTIVPYLVSTVVPSWKSAITDPDSVMRGN